MENEPAWHAKWPDPEHEKIAIEELSKWEELLEKLLFS